MIASSMCMSLMAVTIKYVSQFPLMEIILFRNLPTLIILPIILRKKNISIYGNNRPFLLLRTAFGTIGMIATFYAYTTMPLTEAVAIQQLSPFFIIILSSIFLKEKLFSYQIFILLLAFMGGLLVIKPGIRADIFPALVCLFGAIFIAAAHVILRYLRLTDHSLVVVNYFAFISSLTSLFILLKQENIVIPKLENLPILFFHGFIALFAQSTLTRSYQLAQANLVALYAYFQIVFSGFLSFLIFKERLDPLSILGICLIFIGGYLNYKLRPNFEK